MDSNMQRKGYYEPLIFLPEKIADDEEFVIMNDNIVQNILPYRYMVSNYGRIYDTYSKRIIAQNYDRKGVKNDGTPKGYLYCKIKYRDETGNIAENGKRIRVNRAVAIAFDPVENFKNLEVNHLDGDHSNNRLDNLSWSSPFQNRVHSKANRLNVSGENAANALFTNQQVEKICELIIDGKSNGEILDILNLNVDPRRISDIRNKWSYKYIVEKYDFPGEIRPTITDINNENDYIIHSYLNPLDNTTVYNICEDIMRQEMSYTDIAKKYNVSAATVQNIHAKKTYKNISNSYDFPQTIRFGQLQIDTVEKICKLLEEGNSVKDISKIINIPTEKIQAIYKHYTYTDISKNYKW